MTNIVNPGSTLTVQMATGLTIASNGTVAAGGFLDGAGTITGTVALSDLGTISADVSGGTLVIATRTLTVGGQGTVIANNGDLTIQPSLTLTNLSGSTLTGGTWDAAGAGTLTVMNGPIGTDNAKIVLDGTGAVFNGFQGSLQPIENTLGTVGTAGTLDVLNGRNFANAGSLLVNGVIGLGGGTLSAGGNGVTIAAGATISGFGVLDQGTPIIDLGDILATGGTLAIPAPEAVAGNGTLTVAAGATMITLAEGANYAQTIVNNGTLAITTLPYVPAKMDITGPYSGTGSFQILGQAPGAGGATTLELPGSISANVAFDANVGVLSIDSPASFTGMLSGFTDTDSIVLTGISNAATAVLTGNILSLDTGLGAVAQTLTLDTGSVNYAGATFNILENITHSAATLTVSGAQAACYAEGTRIMTEKGEVPVETLVAGDKVRARYAGVAPVIWLGHRLVDCKRHPAPHKVWPVLVEAHAFGPRLPHRDLYLSPDHAVFVDDVLIPIKYLINKKTIRQIQMERVTYFHVELAEHDVLLAEGLPAESYLENGDRAAFDNGGPAVMLHPEFGARRWEAFGCAPLVVTGALLNRTKSRLDKRAEETHRAPAKRPRAA